MIASTHYKLIYRFFLVFVAMCLFPTSRSSATPGLEEEPEAWLRLAQSSGGLIDDIDDLLPMPEKPKKPEPSEEESQETTSPSEAPSAMTPPPPPPTKKRDTIEVEPPPPPSNPNRIQTLPEDPETSGSGVPVQIQSQGLRAARDGGIAELEQDVIVIQGDLQLESDYAKVYFHTETNEVEKVHAKGNVKVTRESEIAVERIVAKGNEAIFLNEERKVILQGNARLWRGGDLIRGTQITYDMETGWITVDRVEGLVQPGKNGP